MATSSSKDEKPTAKEAFKNNLAPDAKASAKKDDQSKSDDKAAEPSPTAEELAQQTYERQLAEQEEREHEIEASKKGSAVDGLNLPEKQGEILWSTGINIGARKPDEKDKDFDARWADGENTIVAQALTVMAGPGGIRPNGYQLVRDDNNGVLRLNLVSVDPEYPDPARVGGIPNADGTY